jgi:ribonucleotide reductase alpha subunit
MSTFANPLAEQVWKARYRHAPHGDGGETSINATWDRVASALAGAETNDREAWAHSAREVPGSVNLTCFVRDTFGAKARLDDAAPHVDNAISKTINVPADLPFAEFAGIYRTAWEAWEAGLKGCTVFRPNVITGAVLAGPEPRCLRCETVAER